MFASGIEPTLSFDLGGATDVAMQKDVMGYQCWFHLQPDYRQIYKT